MTAPETAEFEIWAGDVVEAWTAGPREQALKEAMHYAYQYSEDGPVTVYEVARTEVISLGKMKESV